MRRKLVSMALVACMSAATLAGCGGGGAAETTAANAGGSAETKAAEAAPAAGGEAAPAEEITLKFTYKQSASNDPLERWLKEKQVIETFEAEHPGVKIELAPISSSEGDYATLLALQLSSEATAPDIFMEDTYMTATDAAAGYLACLDDYLANWEDWDHYLEGTKAAVKGSDGKSYGVPISTDSRGIYYNFEIFKNAGIEVPWQPKTWADIMDAGKKIVESGQDVEPFYLIVGSSNGEAVSMQTFEMLLYGTGDQLYEDGKWLINSKSITDTFQFIYDVYNTEQIGVSIDIALATDANDQIMKGISENTAAMFLTTCTDSGKWASTGAFPVEDVESKIGFAAMPTQNGGDPATVTMTGGWSWAMSEFCKHKDVAFEFLAFCGNQENATNRSLYDGRMSPRDDSVEIAEYGSRAYINEMTSFMSNAYVRPKSESYAMVTTQIQALVEEVATGSLTPEQATAEYAKRVINIVGEENTFTK